MASSLEELLRMADEGSDATDMASTFPAARERFGLSIPPQFYTAEEQALEDPDWDPIDMLAGGQAGARLSAKLMKKGMLSRKGAAAKVAEWGAPIVNVGGIPLPIDPMFYKTILGRPAGWAARKTGLSKLGEALMKPFEDVPSVAGKVKQKMIPYEHSTQLENRFPEVLSDLDRQKYIKSLPKVKQKDFGASQSFEQVHQMMDKSPLERAGFRTGLGESTLSKLKYVKEKGVDEAFRAAQAREAQRDMLGWRMPVAEKYTTMGMRKAEKALAALKAAPVEAAPVKAAKKSRKKVNLPNEKARQMQEKIDMIQKQE